VGPSVPQAGGHILNKIPLAEAKICSHMQTETIAETKVKFYPPKVLVRK